MHLLAKGCEVGRRHRRLNLIRSISALFDLL